MTTRTQPADSLLADCRQATTLCDLLLQYLMQKGYKLLKDDTNQAAEKREGMIAVANYSRKELIDVKGLASIGVETKVQEILPKRTDYFLQVIQSVAEGMFFSLLHFGHYIRGDRFSPALALPDTERYRQIIGNLEEYFTQNNLDFKIYLVAANGEVEERNLNQQKPKSTSVSKQVMEKRKQLKPQS